MKESTPVEARPGTPVPVGDGADPAGGAPSLATAPLDLIPCPYQSLDPRGRILRVNRKWLDRLGYTAEEVIGHLFSEFVADYHAVLFPARFRDFQKKGETLGARFDMVAKNGACLPFLFDGRIESGPDGSMVCTHCLLHDAGDHVRLADSLRRSESRYRSVLATLHEGVLLLDAQQRITQASPRAGELLGLDPEQLQGRTLHDFLDDPGRATVRDLLGRLAKDSECPPLGDDLRFRHQDGHQLAVRARIGTVFDEQRRTLATAMSLLEVSEQARMEEDLREYQDLCHALLDASQDGILIFASENRVAYANRRAAEMHGMSEEQLLATVPRDFMPPDAYRRFRECLAAVDAGREFSSRISGRHADGSFFPAVAYGCAVQMGGRQHYYYALRDVSEMEETALALQESEALYRQLFQSMADGAAIYEVVDDGADFRFRDLNPVGCRHAGLTREEVIGRSIHEVFPGVEEMGILEVFRQVWQSREAQVFPLRHYEDERLSIWVENYVCVLPSDEIVAVYKDVTEQRRREEELRDGQSRLQHLLEIMPVFLDAFDAKGNLLAWNRECERVTGYSAAEVIGNPQALSWMYPDPEVRRRRLKYQDPKGQGFRDMEWTLRCKDGSCRTLLLSNLSAQFPVPGWDSWATGVDVTAYREGERQLASRQAELEEGVRARTEELRAMVTTMAGREVRMAELKEVIRALREQLRRAGLTPQADDPLAGEEKQ